MRSVLIGLAVAAIIFTVATADAQERGRWGAEDTSLFLPDGRDLPPLPTRMEGAWTADEMRIIPWAARLDDKVTLGELSYLAPLTIQGTRDGYIMEFSVRFNEQEVSYFAGHVAGTSIVGVTEMPGGKTTEWAGSWIDDTLTVNTGPAQ